MSAIGELVGVELGPTEWRGGLAGADRRFRGGDRRSAVDPHGSWSARPKGRSGRRSRTASSPCRCASRCCTRCSTVRVRRHGRQLRVDRVRFPAPVPSGSRIRGRFRVASVEEKPLGERGVIEATVECEGVDKPVCVAELVVLTVP